MRQQYYKLLEENNLINILSEIKELSYTKKYSILENLLRLFDNETINQTLTIYKQKYLDIGKVNLNYVKNMLYYLCKEYLKKKK